jgi:hypothetical protein
MTGLAVAIAETFPTDVPVGAHEGVVVPLGTIPCAFSCKIPLPNLIILHEKFRDGGGVFDYALFSNFVVLPLVVLPLSVIPGLGVSLGVGFLGDGLIKLGGRVTLRELFSTVSRTLSKQTRQSLTIKRLECF